MTLLWLRNVIQLAIYPWLVLTNDIYHLKSMKIFNAPEVLTNDAYFGYSVTHDEYRNRLIASAPRFNKTGRIYSCELGKNTDCKIVSTPDIRRDYPAYDHDYWLGATVAGGPNFYVTCAPRYVTTSGAYNIPGEFAACYISAEDGDSLSKLSTLKKRDDRMPFDTPEQEMDSFGWSIAVNDNSVLIGGPAMHTGRAIYYSKARTTSAKPIKVQNTYNFGYSVAFGKFQYNTVSYAVSSTYGYYGEGLVTIYHNLDNKEKLKKGEDANMVGTMYGAVLCAARLSSGKDALIVGAPAYARNKEYDVGAIYVYSQSHKKLTFKRKITGLESGSFFGLAITSAGDLNGDRYDEIAIAAPYEKGIGAVYLYCGATIQSNEVKIKWLQKIQPEIFSPSSMFGLSLSALKDYDGNGCNELAIGAPGADKVAVLHCMASVTVKLRTEFPNLQRRKDGSSSGFTMTETFANFKSCLDVSYPEKPKFIKAKINVKIELTHSSAKLKDGKDGALSYIVPLDRKQTEYCQLIGLDLPKNGNYDLKIGYMITATLLDNPVNHENFDESEVILSDRSILSSSGSIWAAECKRVDACEPKLSLTLNYGSSNDYKYMIGSTDQESISIKLENQGEPAYSACVILRTEGVPIRSLPTNCARISSKNNLIKCEPPMALKNGEEWNTLDIELVTKDLTGSDKEFVIYTELYDYCGNSNKLTNNTIIFKLETDDISKIKILGSTQNYEGNVVNVTKIELSNMKQIEQRYNFKNLGVTNWKKAYCLVKLKKSPYIILSNNTLSVKDGHCSLLGPDRDEYWYAKCTVNKIYKKYENYVSIYVDLISPEDLLPVLQKGNVSIESNILLYIGDEEKIESIVSTLSLREVEVPIWVIICAIIVGLLILLLIGMILRELGCLKRKNQKKLEDLRKSVRRQTIRRSMMIEQRQRNVSQAYEALEDNSNCPNSNDTKETDSKTLENKIMEELRNRNTNEQD